MGSLKSRALVFIASVVSMALFAVLVTACGSSTLSAPNSTPGGNPEETVRISIEQTPSTVAAKAEDLVASVVTAFGQTGGSSVSVYVFGNGRVLSSDPGTPWRFSEFKISDSRVAELRDLAAKRILLEPREAGDSGVTDQDTLVVQILGPSGLVSQRVYGPAHEEGLSNSEKATRADVGAFAEALRALPALPADQFIEAPRPYVPSVLKVQASPVLPIEPDAEPVPTVQPVAWGAVQPLAEVFATDECVLMSGADAEWLRTQAGESQNPVYVPSAVAAPSMVRLVAEPAETALFPCFADTRPPVETAWTASVRSVATPLDRWAAETALHRYAYEGKLGEYSSSNRLTYLELRYARVIDAGQTFVDVVASDRYSSKGPAEFALRVDVKTGDIIEFEVTKDGPA